MRWFFLLVLVSVACAEDGARDDFREGALAAGRWLLAHAEKRGEGIEWPAYEGLHAHPTNLYEGSAGICLFLLNLYEATGDPRWCDAARKAARALLDRARKTEKGICWPDEDEDDDGKVTQKEPSAALYTGTAGIGYVFDVLAEKLHDQGYFDAAKGAADWVVAQAKGDESTVSWGEDADVIAGAAGTGLFLICASEQSKAMPHSRGATRAAEWLLGQEVKEQDGAKWRSTAKLDRFYTGFSHGTAGICDFLVHEYEDTHEQRFLDGAEAGARWLMAVAKKDGGGLKWFHYAPDDADQYWTGWCHGPAGTARFFVDLYHATQKKEYLDAAKAGAEWIRSQLDPSKADAPFYGKSMCCGAAGIGDFFLDLFLTTQDDRDLEYAAGVGRWLLSHGVREGEGMKWTNCETPDEKGKVYYGTGHMIGAAGVGTFLLRLDCACRRTDSAVTQLPDKLRWWNDEPKPKASYVVLCAVDEKDPYYAAAKRLAEYRHGTIVPFRVDQLASAKRHLAVLGARYVAIVLHPQELDVNVHRRILMMSTQMTDNPFPRFAFGYITGPTPEAAMKLVEGAIQVEKEGLSKTMVQGSVVSDMESCVVEDPPSTLAKELGWSGKAIYWAERESDPNVLGFVQQHLRDLEKKGVVMLSGNSDPEGIWLFSGDRNMDPAKHWPFDPKKVGQDDKGEMPRILAKDLRGLDLSRAVVWSGTCHSGVTYREFVEGDIVSTFGKVDAATEYLVPEGRSLAMAILGDGPSAFLAPIGPNHGYATLVESWRALATGMPLGDVMRTRYDELVLAEGGPLRLALLTGGKPEPAEDPMRGGGANRLLFGDPLYRPFPAAGKESIHVETRLDGGKFLVRCKVVDASSGLFWDMFGGDRENPERLYVVAELPEAFHPGDVTARATADGREVPLANPCLWGEEEIDGKRLLHLQANGKRDTLGKLGVEVEFTVTAAPR